MADGAPEDEHNNGTQPAAIIVGAGPAGLTAAYELDRRGRATLVLEKDREIGGISRTVNYKGYCFDIGGHRFFSKVTRVVDFWNEILGDEFLSRPRISRIFYRGRFFDYPLKPMNALQGLGLWESALCGLSYLKAQAFPRRDETSFESWVINRFGNRLYQTFFKTYTEKVWGMSCKDISADWAAQRIKGLSLASAVFNALLPRRGTVIKTLIETFEYPRKGPGMMWERVAELVGSSHGEVQTDAAVERIRWQGTRVQSVLYRREGALHDVPAPQLVSSMPLGQLIEALDPPAPEHVREAANALEYRDFLTVALIVKEEALFPDNWVYIHEPGVKVGRVQNFKNWSPEMVPDPSTSCLGLEYFCFEGDRLWTMSDNDLVALGADEATRLGLIPANSVIDGTVVRMPKAYPVYNGDYQQHVDTIRTFLDAIDNLYAVGRNGMHKYNNQDHSMLAAMLAVENIHGADFDLWSVNEDQQYHEQITADEVSNRELSALAATQPLVPERLMENAPAPRRLDKPAFAAALAIIATIYASLGAIWFADATSLAELVKSGVFMATFSGFLLGWLLAYTHNALLGLLRKRATRGSQSTDPILDYV
ncbi:MAG: NAD(P)/FAD-dependent oxidoreductase [Pseudomonadota bacterium]